MQLIQLGMVNTTEKNTHTLTRNEYHTVRKKAETMKHAILLYERTTYTHTNACTFTHVKRASTI